MFLLEKKAIKKRSQGEAPVGEHEDRSAQDDREHLHPPGDPVPGIDPRDQEAEHTCGEQQRGFNPKIPASRHSLLLPETISPLL